MLFALALAGVLAGCGGGSGGGGGGGGSSSSTPDPSVRVTITGRVTYDFVPVDGRLDYANTEARPVRLATVQFIAGTTPTSTNVLVSTQTDTDGNYSMSVPSSRTGFVRVQANSERTGTPGWHFRVVDNTSGDAVYVLDGSAVSSGTSDSVRDLHAASGWVGGATTGSYANERAAAPFAVLDTIQVGAEYVLAAYPVAMPALDVHWSLDNIADFDANGATNPETGEIGGTFYGFNPSEGIEGIYLLGEANADTEEYDRHVILHEFGHYLIHRFSRGDNIGGPHSTGDALDMRVAFNEGWPTAFAALALADPIYVDTLGNRQAQYFWFDVEAAPFLSPNPVPGWFSEESIWELVYDLVDADVDGNDTLSYPFADIMDAMAGPVAETRSLVSIFPFWSAIKSAKPADVAVLDQLTTDQSIAPVQDEWGTGETNDADATNPEDVLPVYTEIMVNDATPVNLCSTDEFTSPISGAVNKLGSAQFLYFTPPALGQVTVTVRATDIPAGEFADPDWIAYNAGALLKSDHPPTDECKLMTDPAQCVEPNPTMTAIRPPVDTQPYVLEIYEWTNTNDVDDAEFPPIGRTCFDITVTQP